jgi:LppX_LprAFG lipoprotein
MLRGRRAGVAAAFAVAAAATITAGCGGGGRALALDPVAAAATKSQHAGAAHIRFSLGLSAPQLRGKMLQIRGTGAIDGASGEMKVGLGSALPQAGLPAGTSLKEIFLEENGDFVTYLRAGFLSAQIPGGKHWAKLDLTKLGKSAGIDLSQLMPGGQFQPSDLLSMLKAEGATVRTIGSETVDGTATTHYRVTVDMAKALQAKGLSSPTLTIIAAEMPTVPGDVWVGKDGLVHRIRLSLGMQQGGKPLRMAMSMDLFDYGANVTIAAPPSSDVFDATPFAQQGLGKSFNF